MKQPLVTPLDRNATPQAAKMADFYDETLGFTPNSLFTMMHRPRIADAFVEMNQAVMENKGRVTSALKREIAYLSAMQRVVDREAHAIRAASVMVHQKNECNTFGNTILMKLSLKQIVLLLIWPLQHRKCPTQ